MIDNKDKLILPSPLEAWSPEILTIDGQGEYYLPYKDGIRLSPRDLFQDGRPGFPISIHTSDIVREDGIRAVDLMLEEGILIRSRFSILSPCFHHWRFKNQSRASLVCATPYVHTREETRLNETYNYVKEIYDPLIGISVSEARLSVPHGWEYVREKFAPQGTGDNLILRYVPPRHIIAVIGDSQEEERGIKDYLEAVETDFQNGELSEQDVKEIFNHILNKLPVEIRLPGMTQAELSLRLAAAFTEIMILKIISRLAYDFYGRVYPDPEAQRKFLQESENKTKKSLERLKPSFSFTKGIVAMAREIVFGGV